MFGFGKPKNPDAHRYYLLPGQGRGARRKHRQQILAAWAVGIIAAALLGATEEPRRERVGPPEGNPVLWSGPAPDAVGHADQRADSVDNRSSNRRSASGNRCFPSSSRVIQSIAAQPRARGSPDSQRHA